MDAASTGVRRRGTNSDYWSSKFIRNRERDADTDARLIVAGWAVVRVWEHEDPTEVARLVAAAIAAKLGEAER
jgi:DNA mismatch endonuclease, patch repair protein